MKKLVLSLLFLSSGCSTVDVTAHREYVAYIEDVSRASYHVGCVEGLLALAKTHEERGRIVRYCELRSQQFDPTQIGITVGGSK